MAKTLWQVIQEAEEPSTEDIRAELKRLDAAKTRTPAPIAAIKTHLYTTGEYELYEFLENCEWWEVRNKDAPGWPGTAGVSMGPDKIYFVYDKDFIDRLAKKPSQLILLVAHEASHILRFHHDRSVAAKQKPDLSNVAQDMIINDDILRSEKIAGWKPEMPTLSSIKELEKDEEDIVIGHTIPDKFRDDFKDVGRKAYYSENMYNWLNANEEEREKAEGAPQEKDYFEEGALVRVNETGEYKRITKVNKDGTYDTESIDIEKEIAKVKGS
jgi:hypothetical protein